MGVFHGLIHTLFLFFLFLLVLQRSDSATVVVDGVNQWNDPVAAIGDTICKLFPLQISNWDKTRFSISLLLAIL